MAAGKLAVAFPRRHRCFSCALIDLAASLRPGMCCKSVHGEDVDIATSLRTHDTLVGLYRSLSLLPHKASIAEIVHCESCHSRTSDSFATPNHALNRAWDSILLN